MKSNTEYFLVMSLFRVGIAVCIGIVMPLHSKAGGESPAVRDDGTGYRLQIRTADAADTRSVGSISGSGVLKLNRNPDIYATAIYRREGEYEEILFAIPWESSKKKLAKDIKAAINEKWEVSADFHTLPATSQVAFLIECDKQTGKLPALGVFRVFYPTDRDAVFQWVGRGNFVLAVKTSEEGWLAKKVNTERSGVAANWSTLETSKVDVGEIEAILKLRRR